MRKNWEKRKAESGKRKGEAGGAGCEVSLLREEASAVAKASAFAESMADGGRGWRAGRCQVESENAEMVVLELSQIKPN